MNSQTVKIVILFLFITLIRISSFSQSKHSISIQTELMGPGWYNNVRIIPVVFLEGKIQTNGYFSLSTRVGIGASRWKDVYSNWNPDLIIPIQIGIEGGKTKVRPEFQLGFITSSFTQFDESDLKRYWAVSGLVTLGCRFVFSNRLSARLVVNTLWDNVEKWKPSGAISINYTLKSW
ncbi:MAG: hypothetical protein MUE33_12560 [Cytophagaceae bacterium]|jgi:hypothetical protein|nr:hypothetical protein [Cytophagaceae bacterium]